MTSTFNLGQVHRTVSFLLADFAELLLVVEFDSYTSIHKNDLHSIIGSADIHTEELDLLDHSIIEKATSAQDRHYEDCWGQLEYRSSAYGDAYPFSVEGKTVAIKTNLNPSQRIYSFLLCASRLRSFGSGSITNKWAGYFAELSRHAMKGLLPREANAYIFDANSNDRKNIFGTDYREALIKLGAMLSVDIIEKNCREESSSGDGGLDLVGILDFSDGAKGNLAFFGQCASRERDWPSKTLEASPVRFRSFFSILSDPANLFFFPGCYRRSDGAWPVTSKSSGCTLLDRSRILNLIGKQGLFDSIVSESWFEQFEQDLATYK